MLQDNPHMMTHNSYRAYRSWTAMRDRVNNKSSPQYADYGGRGIEICEEWDTLEGFLNSMGERPNLHSIDRIDVNEDYKPSNCRWANRITQNRNTRRNGIVYKNKIISLSELCEIMGKSYSATHKALFYRGKDIRHIFNNQAIWA